LVFCLSALSLPLCSLFLFPSVSFCLYLFPYFPPVCIPLF
jgi:hypothetical protein